MKHAVGFAIVVVLAVAGPALAGNRVVVEGLPRGTTFAEVAPLVASYGAVGAISVESMDRGGEMRVRAIVDFEREEGAERAAAALDGAVVDGQTVRAELRSTKPFAAGAKLRDFVRGAGLRDEGDVVQGVSDRVHELLDAAIKRGAVAGEGGTAQPYDL